jgi:gamma-glutamyl phosphate reductase
MDLLFDAPEIREFLVQALQQKVSEIHPGKEIDVSDNRLLMQVVALTRWLKMSTKRWTALIQGSALLLSASDPSSQQSGGQ